LTLLAARRHPTHLDVVQFLLEDPGVEQARAKYRNEISIAEWLRNRGACMQPLAAAQGWALPVIETLGDLADWLCLSISELEWFADLKGLGYKVRNQKLHHYRILAKRSGGVRLLESPKSNLKALHRRILSGILDRVPAHPGVHGFVKGRSIATFAAPHAGKQVIRRLDVQDFFPSFPAARVQALFRTLGYSESASDCLGGISTNAVPRDVWNRCPPEIDRLQCSEARTLYARPHLPQCAPTSPAFANITAYRLDCRLLGLARSPTPCTHVTPTTSCSPEANRLTVA
jgi:RNA-directed DNA polymerase